MCADSFLNHGDGRLSSCDEHFPACSGVFAEAVSDGTVQHLRAAAG